MTNGDLLLVLFLISVMGLGRLWHRLKEMMSVIMRHNLELMAALHSVIEDMQYGEARSAYEQQFAELAHRHMAEMHRAMRPLFPITVNLNRK